MSDTKLTSISEEQLSQFILDLALAIRICNIRVSIEEAVDLIGIAEIVREKGSNATIEDFRSRNLIQDMKNPKNSVEKKKPGRPKKTESN